MKYFSFLLNILIVVSFLQVYGQNLVSKFQDTLDFYRPMFKVIGASAAVELPDGNTWTGVTGWSDNIDGTPVDTNMVFAIGSITKTYTATLLLKLMENGFIFSLDDSLGIYLSLTHPNIDESITLRQLFHHTSGLYDYVTDSAFGIAIWTNPTYWWPPHSPLAYVRAPYFAPGTGFRYSNTNYLILGLIAKKLLSINRLGEFIRDSLLQTAECHQTFFFPEMDLPDTLPIAHPHFDINGTPESQEDIFSYPRIALHSAAWTAGCIYATAKDLTRFISKLFQNQIISNASVTLMTQFSPYNYGLGVGRGFYRGYEFWAHGGAILGYTAMYIHVPALHITLSLLTNNSQNVTNVRNYAIKLLDVAINAVLTNIQEQLHQKLDIVVAPNPPKSYLIISPVLSPVAYEMITLDGRRIKSGMISPAYPYISIADLPHGLYVMHIGRGAERRIVRFIK